MCGILGAAGAIAPLRDRFAGALDLIAHRGPDGEGVHAAERVLLGHRRLAIIDLTCAGDQPMTDPETGVTLVFNGEIYNYIEVRDELIALGERFRSRSDTEVLLRAWLRWGQRGLDRLNGMWAFAVWDPRDESLTLCRDRFGVKPLVYAASAARLMFASEAKALIGLEPALAEPDRAAIADFLVDSRAREGDRTFQRDIRALPPATLAVWRQGDSAPRLTSWWAYPTPEAGAADPDEFTALFEDAVRLRLRSDVPLGLTLSGGLDSSATLAAAQPLLPGPMRCLTSVYGTSRGEEPWAKIAAEAAGAGLEAVSASAEDWLPTLKRILWHMDGPGFTIAVFPLWTIMAHARAERVPVLLEGQGADELLGGYPQYGALEALSMARRVATGAAPPAALAASLRGLAGSATLRQGLLWMARIGLAPLARAAGPRRGRVAMLTPETRARLGERGAPRLAGADPLRQALYEDHHWSILPSLLHYGDAISMAHGIETRLPFMDYRLVEWVFRNTPPLFENGLSKAPVRRYLHARRMAPIAERRDKQGYPTPTADWMRADATRSEVEAMLADGAAPVWEHVRREPVQAMWRRATAGDYAPGFHMYKLLGLHLWLAQAPSIAQTRPLPVSVAA